jgi:hypothetical protein
MLKLFSSLFVLFFSSFLYAQQGIQSKEYCQIQLIGTEQSSSANSTSENLIRQKQTLLSLPVGESRLRLTCRLDEQAVFSFCHD